MIIHLLHRPKVNQGAVVKTIYNPETFVQDLLEMHRKHTDIHWTQKPAASLRQKKYAEYLLKKMDIPFHYIRDISMLRKGEAGLLIGTLRSKLTKRPSKTKKQTKKNNIRQSSSTQLQLALIY